MAAIHVTALGLKSQIVHEAEFSRRKAIEQSCFHRTKFCWVSVREDLIVTGSLGMIGFSAWMKGL